MIMASSVVETLKKLVFQTAPLSSGTKTYNTTQYLKNGNVSSVIIQETSITGNKSYDVPMRNANLINPTTNTTPKPKSKHIELTNDITLQMETEYGRVRMQIEIGKNIGTRYLICLLCNYHNLAKCGIKVRLARKHNELQKTL